MAKVIDFTAPKTANAFAADVAELKELGVPTPEGKAIGIEVKRDEVKSARNKVSAAARELGFTARYRQTIDTDPASEVVTLVYTARELDAPRVKGAKGDETPAPEVTEDAPKPVAVKRG